MQPIRVTLLLLGKDKYMPAKNYSKKQMAMARLAEPRNKITGADLKKLRDKKKNSKG